MFKSLSSTAKKMMLIVLVLFTFSSVLGLIIVSNKEFNLFITGLLLGTACTQLKIYLTDKAINRTLQMEPGQSQDYLKLQFILRYILTITVVSISAVISAYSFFGTALGIVFLPITGYLTGLLIKD